MGFSCLDLLDGSDLLEHGACGRGNEAPVGATWSVGGGGGGGGV